MRFLFVALGELGGFLLEGDRSVESADLEEGGGVGGGVLRLGLGATRLVGPAGGADGFVAR